MKKNENNKPRNVNKPVADVQHRNSIMDSSSASSSRSDRQSSSSGNISVPPTQGRRNNSETSSVNDNVNVTMTSVKDNVQNVNSSNKIPKMNSLNRDSSSENREETNKEQGNNWAEVVRRNKRPTTTLFCTGIKESNASQKIKGAQRKKWLYVGRISGKDTTEGDLKEYLLSVLPNVSLEVKKLQTKGNNSAFSVGVTSNETFDQLCKPEIWPGGVVVREFNFKNFFPPRTRSIPQS